MPAPTVAVDFDGVIHSYASGWKGVAVIPDPPVPGAGAALLSLVRSFTVAIHSSRSKNLRGRWAMKRYVRGIVRDACFADADLIHAAWTATQGSPPDWIPWTAGDVNEAADWIFKAIKWPWFKPAAVLTIDDRAVTFNGDWSHFDYSPEGIRGFKPWNKKSGSPNNSTSNGATVGASPSAARIQSIPTA